MGKRLTKNMINEIYKDVLRNRFTGDKNRFGWYYVDLKNGKVATGSNLEELKEDIETKKDSE
jgi:hypothetical protein